MLSDSSALTHNETEISNCEGTSGRRKSGRLPDSNFFVLQHTTTSQRPVVAPLRIARLASQSLCKFVRHSTDSSVRRDASKTIWRFFDEESYYVLLVSRTCCDELFRCGSGSSVFAQRCCYSSTDDGFGDSTARPSHDVHEFWTGLRWLPGNGCPCSCFHLWHLYIGLRSGCSSCLQRDHSNLVSNSCANRHGCSNTNHNCLLSSTACFCCSTNDNWMLRKHNQLGSSNERRSRDSILDANSD